MDIPEFVQVTVTRTMFGTSTTEAWRLDARGRAEAGRWTSSRQLESQSRTDRIDPALFAALRDHAQRPTTPDPAAPSDPAIAAQPSPGRYEIALWSGRGATVRSGGPLPEDLAALLARVSAALRPVSMPGGGVIWTQPAAGLGRVDHDLTATTCSAPWLAEALSGGGLLVPLPDEGQSLLTGENAQRGAFGVRLDNGAMLFGPLVPR